MVARPLPSGLRSALGPVCIGLAVWCAAGRITLAAFDSPSIRLVLPAPWWVIVVATAFAFLVPAWRLRPALTAPALLATLAWWPVPLPPIGLIWTGPLAWLPIGLSLIAAVIAQRGVKAETEDPAPSNEQLWRVAAALTLAIGIIAAWQLSPRLPGGDEPHYLVITQSLIKDGDLRIENNHRARDYAAYYPGSLAPDVIRRGRDGQIYSIHAPGLSVLVLPAFWLFGYRGAQAMVLIAAALAGGLIWRVGWRATGSASAAWFAWAAVAGSATAVVQSATVFPDGPAALTVAASVLLLLTLAAPHSTKPVSVAMLVGVSVLLAVLPWLHTRFAVIALGFGLLVAWAILRETAAGPADRLQRLAWFFAVPTLSAIGWFAFFQVIYGTPNPAAPYGDRPEASWTFIPGGVTGILFDQQFGLIAYAPVLAAAAVGLALGRRSPARLVAAWSVAVAGVYLLVVGTYWMWWAGVPATPARFAAAVLPVFALPLALAWARPSVVGRAVLSTALILSLAITALVIGVDRGAIAWNVRGGAALWLEWLGPVVDLARGWPSFFWRLSPEDLSTEIPFFVHVFAWLAIAAAIGATGWIAVRRMSKPADAAPLVAAWSVALGLMAMIQVGWWLNRVNGPSPGRSQIALLGGQRAGRQPIRIAALSVARVADLAGILRIRPNESGAPGSPVWGSFRALPAGTYELRIVTTRPRQGELGIRIGRAARPWRTLTVLPLSRQAFVVSLPADISGLTIEPDAGLKEIGGTLELAPLAIRKDATANALAVMRYAMTDVFFLDQNTFVEEGGFWVQGGQTADVVLAAGAGRAGVSLVLRNGSAPNRVRLQADADTQTIALQPDEERAVTIPVAGPDGVVRLRVTSDAGFRPADTAGADRRYLGVRIEFR